MRKRDAEGSGGGADRVDDEADRVDDEADRVDDEADRRREEEDKEDTKEKNQKPNTKNQKPLRDSNPSRARSPREELAFRVRVSLAASEANLG